MVSLFHAVFVNSDNYPILDPAARSLGIGNAKSTSFCSSAFAGATCAKNTQKPANLFALKPQRKRP
jgi:hypothetical protein